MYDCASCPECRGRESPRFSLVSECQAKNTVSVSIECPCYTFPRNRPGRPNTDEEVAIHLPPTGMEYPGASRQFVIFFSYSAKKFNGYSEPSRFLKDNFSIVNLLISCQQK